jgi:hypothetical protein
VSGRKDASSAPTKGVRMRWIKSSALLLAASLTLGAGLTVVSADPAAGQTGPAAAHAGSDKVTLTGLTHAHGATLVGATGN